MRGFKLYLSGLLAASIATGVSGHHQHRHRDDDHDHQLHVGCDDQQAVFNFDDWTHNDLVDYVQDHMDNLKDLSTKSLEDLKCYLSSSSKDMEARYAPHAHKKKAWWQVWSSDGEHDFPWTKSNTPISDWLFDTWSTDQLHRFLENYKIDFDPNATKDSLVEKAKQNFYDISKNLNTSGFYPSSSYFSDWSTSDLTKWLDQYHIPYSEEMRDKRQELLHKVKQNLYQASQYSKERRIDILKSLETGTEKLKDPSGNLTPDMFEHWSNEDLEDWLKSHDIRVDSKLGSKHKYLVKLAAKNIDLLKDDMKWYTLYQSKSAMHTANKMLHKPPKFMASVWEHIKSRLCSLIPFYKKKVTNKYYYNDASGLGNWSRKRLQTFLDVRNIPYHTLATRTQLLKLVEENKKKPIENIPDNYSKLFDKLPLDQVQDWLKDKRHNLEKAKVTDAVNAKLEGMQKNGNDWKAQMVEKWYGTLNSWSTDDLKHYLNSFGVQTAPTSTKDDLINMVKEKTQVFFGYEQHLPWYKRIARRVECMLNGAYSAIFHR